MYLFYRKYLIKQRLTEKMGSVILIEHFYNFLVLRVIILNNLQNIKDLLKESFLINHP
jgi:hypothetical protein